MSAKWPEIVANNKQMGCRSWGSQLRLLRGSLEEERCEVGLGVRKEEKDIFIWGKEKWILKSLKVNKLKK